MPVRIDTTTTPCHHHRPYGHHRRGVHIVTTAWSSDELDRIGRAEELEIAAERADGTPRRWAPIWVVRVGEQVYVRTWYRRDTGWFGHVLESRKARIRVPGLEARVAVEDVGADSGGRRTDVDAAYRTKYGRHGASVDRMIAPDAVATTLRLTRDQPAPSAEPGPG